MDAIKEAPAPDGATEDEQEAHGWGVLHTTVEPSKLVDAHGETAGEGHVIGPFPTAEFAEAFHALVTCECIKTVVPMAFPPGMTMLLDGRTMIDAIARMHPNAGPVMAFLDALEEQHAAEHDDNPLTRALTKAIERARRSQRPAWLDVDLPTH